MHPNEEAKRAAEHSVFTAFLRCAAWVKIGEEDFRSGNAPYEPDIVANRDGQHIGVEITGLDLPNLRVQEAAESKTINHARKAYEVTGGPPIEVRIYGLRVDNDKMISAVGEALASFVSKNVPNEGGWRTASWQELSPPLSDALASVSINRLVDLTRSFWNAGHARFVPPVSSKDLQSEIDRKNEKTKLYSTQYHERWLLLNGMHFAAWGELSPDCREATYLSSFEHVFYLGAFGDPRVTELRIH